MKSVKDDVVTCYCRFHLMRESRWLYGTGTLFDATQTREVKPSSFLPFLNSSRVHRMLPLTSHALFSSAVGALARPADAAMSGVHKSLFS